MGSGEAEDWTQLVPEAILLLILESFVNVYDHMRCKSVCKRWNSVLKLTNKQKRMESWNLHLPFLMIPSNNGRKEDRSLFNMVSGKSCDFQLSLRYNKRCCGHSYGWLATVGKNMIITLRNPFLNNNKTQKNVIRLPPIMKPVHPGHTTKQNPYYFEYMVEHLVLSRDPALYPYNYQVAAIAVFGYTSTLAVLDSATQSWTVLHEISITPSNHHSIYSDNKWLVLDAYGKLISVDTNTTSNVKVDVIVKGKKYIEEFLETIYLVKSSQGVLLRLVRSFNVDDGKTLFFNVFKLTKSSHKENKHVWCKLESLGEDALFAGDCSSFCVKAANFSGCKPNSIYFTPHFWTIDPKLNVHDTGVFNMEDGTIKSIYPCHPSHENLPPPFWVVPWLGDEAWIHN